MEIINKIPTSLYKDLADKLVSVILDSEDRNALSSETTKRIIYLWRQDQLASLTGIETLLRAGVIVNQMSVEKILNDLGLQEVSVVVCTL